MSSIYLDILVGCTVTVVSFGFMYNGWKMLKQKRKILIWPARLIFFFVSVFWGRDTAKRRQEFFLNRARFYEVSVLIGGAIGFIGGLIYLIDSIQNIILLKLQG